jgi:hypothetical protein
MPAERLLVRTAIAHALAARSVMRPAPGAVTGEAHDGKA